MMDGPNKETAEEVMIRGREISASSPEGQLVVMNLEKFIRILTGGGGPQGERNCVLPDGVKLVRTRGPMTLWVYERPPQVYSLQWIANDSPVPFGAGTKYRTVRIAIPYLVILVVFLELDQGDFQLSDYNECFFRNAPLKNLRDKLFYPALLNCSKFPVQEGKPLSWICTAKMNRKRMAAEKEESARLRAGLQALLHCLLETGYNRSSEYHEESSWFTQSTRVDSRIATVEKWQETTACDPLFVLDVPWLKTKMTLGEVIERTFANVDVPWTRVASAADLKRILFNHARQAERT